MERSLINSETGEVIYDLMKGDRLVRATSIAHFKEMQEIARQTRPFAKVDMTEGALLMSELDNNERALLFTLERYVSYDSGLIQYRNGRDITFTELVSLMGWSKATTSQTVNKLIEKNIIYKGKNGRNVQYFMNPWVISRGNDSNQTLKKMFKHYAIRSKGGITWEEWERSNGRSERREGAAESDIRGGQTGEGVLN